MAANDDRFFGGPRPLGAILPRLTRPAFKRRSPAGAQLMADWPAVVGPALAAVSVPKRLSAGTLTLACSGPIAMELSHLAPELIARINTHLGGAQVQRLRFVQEAPRQMAVSAPRPEPQLPARVAASLTEVRSEALRAALEKLARGVYRTRG
jgi:hypothetical protein